MSHQTQAWPASVALPSFCVDIHSWLQPWGVVWQEGFIAPWGT